MPTLGIILYVIYTLHMTISDIHVYQDGWLVFGDQSYRCALGKNGIHHHKTEGDNVTPEGTFPLREVWYRPDHVAKITTKLPVRPITPEDGWCDEPTSKDYNRSVRLPFVGSHEELYRHDEVYDIVVPIGYNDDPPVVGAGSAIFMHVARAGYTPTAGCVALKEDDLIALLEAIEADTQIVTHASSRPSS